MRHGTGWSLLMVALAVLGSMAPARAGGIDPGDITFFVSMGDCGLSGSAAAGSTVRVIVRDRADRKVLDRQVTANESGTWHAECIDGRFKGGEHITARSDGTLRRLLVVPRLSLIIDRGANEARGHGPASGPPSVHLGIDACVPGLITCEGSAVDVDVATDPSTGDWEYPFGSFDTGGADNGRVVWSSTFGDQVYRLGRTPYLQVEAGSAGVRGFGRPGVPLTVTLRSSSGVLRATATATPSAPYSGWTATFRRNGVKVKVRVGDRVTATFASDASLRVRDIPISADVGNDQIHGRCRPGGAFGVRWVDDAGAYQGQGYGTSNLGDGNWTVLAPGIDTGWTFTAWCDNAAGDVVRRVFVVP